MENKFLTAPACAGSAAASMARCFCSLFNSCRSSSQHHACTPERETNGKAGVTPDFIRLSIGLEDIEDILWDLDLALESALKKAKTLHSILSS